MGGGAVAEAVDRRRRGGAGRMQGVSTAVVAGGPRLGDVRAGAVASVTTLTISWSGGAVLCAGLVLVAAVAVRPFRRYDAGA